MNIGKHVPSWKTPCLSNGGIEFISLTANREKPLVLCCTPALAEIDAWLLESQANKFHDYGMVLAVLAYGDQWLRQHWIRPPHEFRLRFFTDPLRRLVRTLRLSSSLPSHKSETWIFDQYSRLNFCLLHKVNLRNLTKVLEMTEKNFSLQSNCKLWEKTVQPELCLLTALKLKRTQICPHFRLQILQHLCKKTLTDITKRIRRDGIFEKFLIN